MQIKHKITKKSVRKEKKKQKAAKISIYLIMLWTLGDNKKKTPGIFFSLLIIPLFNYNYIIPSNLINLRHSYII